MWQVEICASEFAKQRAGAHVGLAKPRALLAAQAEHRDGPARPGAFAPEVDEAQQTGDDARESVEVAALRDGVQMRPDVHHGVGCFVGKAEDKVLRRVARGR